MWQLLAQLGLPFILSLLNRGGGEDEPSGQIGTEIPEGLQNMLAMSMLQQGRQSALTDPGGYEFYGLDAPPSGSVPLRTSANQLAYALLPNYVRPSDGLFPGVAPPTGFDALPEDSPFFGEFGHGSVGQHDPGGSGPGGRLTSGDIRRRLNNLDVFGPLIETGVLNEGPNGRIQLTGEDPPQWWTDLRERWGIDRRRPFPEGFQWPEGFDPNEEFGEGGIPPGFEFPEGSPGRAQPR